MSFPCPQHMCNESRKIDRSHEKKHTYNVSIHGWLYVQDQRMVNHKNDTYLFSLAGPTFPDKTSNAPRHEKTRRCCMQTTKAQTSLCFHTSLISVCIIRYLKSSVVKLAPDKRSLLAEQAGWFESKLAKNTKACQISSYEIINGNLTLNRPRGEKTCLLGFRQSEIQTSLLSYSD